MSGRRSPLFLIATLGSFALLVLFMVLLMVMHEKEAGLPTPVVQITETKKAVSFPESFGSLGALVPFSGGVAPIAAQVVPVDHAPEFRDDAWLRAQNSEMFTIQVMAAKDEEAVKRYLASREDRAQFVYFLHPQDGSNWYVVTTGSYASVELARGVAETRDFGISTRPFPKRMDLYKEAALAPAAPASPAPPAAAPAPAPATAP